MKHPTWFESWFNCPYYHILYKNRDENEAAQFLINLVKLLKPTEDENFLDLACGKGRHARFLSKMGYHTTGIDLAENSIAAAKKYETERLKFLVHDMREPLSEQFDYILNLFTSFGYFDSKNDEQKAINNMKTMLKPNGKLIIDYMNPKYVLNTLVSEEIKRIDGISFHITRNLQDDFIVKTIQFEHLNTRHRYQEKVRAIYWNEFKALLLATGFQIINTFGDYNLAPFHEESSPRCILYASHS